MSHCNVVGYSSDGKKTLSCGCIEKLEYETSSFGEPGGWGKSYPYPNNNVLCKIHAKEKEYNEKLAAQKEEIFKQVYGFSMYDIQEQISKIQKQIDDLTTEKNHLQTQLQTMNKIYYK